MLDFLMAKGLLSVSVLSLVLEEMNLIKNPKLEIPAHEIQWRFSRSSGSGGQNVNKTDSRV